MIKKHRSRPGVKCHDPCPWGRVSRADGGKVPLLREGLYSVLKLGETATRNL